MQIRDRIVEFCRVPANQLRPHPRNWRVHPPAQQEALRGVLAEIGFAGAVLARRLADGSLQLVDGHLRVETMTEAEVPVLVVDLDEQEADKLLALYDPLSAMAEQNQTQWSELVARVQTAHPALEALLDAMTAQIEEAAGELAAPAAEHRLEPIYQVVVDCRDEAQQQSLYERLSEEGLRCRVLTL